MLKQDALERLPPEWPDNLLPEIQRHVRATGQKVVVLDDDPTGTQTVHDIPVLTEWPVDALRAELESAHPAFYLLTNSRSLTLPAAQALNNEIGRNLLEAARQSGRTFAVVSRSDSTLRGHFPGEVEALAAALETDFDAWLIIPFFLEGGRYTLGDVHYVAEGDALIPAGETPFARDAVFGYRASDLRAWVEEKTGGRFRAARVASVSLDDLRLGGQGRVTERLLGLPKGGVCVVNAASYRDLEVFVAGLLDAEAQGRRYLYRTAASFVRVRAGIPPRALLGKADLDLPAAGGGLFVVGSYVPRTTAQVNALLAQPGLCSVPVDVAKLLDGGAQRDEIARAADAVNGALRRGQDVVAYTSRALVTGEDAQRNLAIGQQVSAGLVALTRAIATRPRYLVAKGGVTSSDIATRGLAVRRALVMGQILPGVPVWRLGPESRYPGLPYCVFPGNVGGPEALAEIARALRPDAAA